MKKVILLLTVLGCFISGNANAGFISGWGFKWGSIDVFIELKGTGKTSDGDEVQVDIILTNLEYVCGNPGTNTYVVDGTPGLFNFTKVQSVDDIKTVTKNGKTTVTVTIDIENQEVEIEPSVFVPLYDTLECVNSNWTVLLGSVAPSAFDARIIWYDEGADITCVDVPDWPDDLGSAPYPTTCTGGKDRVEAVCTLDPILRYPENTTIDDEDVSLLPVKGQIFNCVDITDL